PPRLWLVTRGAQAPEPDSAVAALAQSPLWGLGRTIALEYPDLWGGLIDLPADVDDPTAAGLLLRELRRGDREDQIARRGARRPAPRLVRLAPAALGARQRIRSDATYWIVGGRGAVGLETAAALVDAGAQHLVITGRRASPESGAAELQELGRRAHIVGVAGDGADEADGAGPRGHGRPPPAPPNGG